MRFRPLLLALAPVLFFATGCAAKKLNESAALKLDKEFGARSLDVPAQKKTKTVTVEFSSSEGTVHVLVFKATDAPNEDALITADSAKAIAKKRGKADTFTADLPENTAVRIVVREHTATQTDVALKVVEN